MCAGFDDAAGIHHDDAAGVLNRGEAVRNDERRTVAHQPLQRFLRKLPLLKGLSDNDLIRAAARMPQRVYQDGQALIKYGERGDELFLIRYGKVRKAGGMRTRT